MSASITTMPDFIATLFNTVRDIELPMACNGNNTLPTIEPELVSMIERTVYPYRCANLFTQIGPYSGRPDTVAGFHENVPHQMLFWVTRNKPKNEGDPASYEVVVPNGVQHPAVEDWRIVCRVLKNGLKTAYPVIKADLSLV